MMELTPLWDNKATPEQLAELEAEIGAALPDDYRSFLLSKNGGILKNGKFLINEKEGHSTIDMFYGITENRSYDLLRNYFMTHKDITKPVLPIGEDPGGNRICIGLSGKQAGKIYFYDHEQPKGKNLYHICDGFSEFLSRLE